MNEKIRKISMLAEQFALDNANEGDEEEFEYSFEDDYNEKFTELIINECINVINDDCKFQYDSGVISNLGGLNQARELIKRHFGVE